jgi:hypothetical protein
MELASILEALPAAPDPRPRRRDYPDRRAFLAAFRPWQSRRNPIVVVHVDGRRQEFAALTFRKVQEIVGGYVQHLPLKSGWVVLVNEDGRHLGLRANHPGTAAARAVDNGRMVWALPGRPGLLLGAVVLLPPDRVSEVLGDPPCR